MTLTNNRLYTPALSFHKYFDLMMDCVGRKYWPLFKLIKYKIVVFDEYIFYSILILF